MTEFEIDCESNHVTTFDMSCLFCRPWLRGKKTPMQYTWRLGNSSGSKAIYRMRLVLEIWALMSVSISKMHSKWIREWEEVSEWAELPFFYKAKTMCEFVECVKRCTRYSNSRMRFVALFCVNNSADIERLHIFYDGTCPPSLKREKHDLQSKAKTTKKQQKTQWEQNQNGK